MLTSGDFDGDGHQDIVTLDDQGVRVHSFDGQGQPISAFEVAGGMAFPQVGRLTTDSLDDLALLGSVGLGALRVWQGQHDRTLTPTAYSPISGKGYGLRGMLLADAMPSEAQTNINDSGAFATQNVGDELLLVSSDWLVALPLWDASGIKKTIELVHIPKYSATTANQQLHAANYVDGGKCQTVVIAADKDSELLAFEPCRWAIDHWEWNEHATPRHIKLPEGAIVDGGAVSAYVDTDSHRDIVVFGADRKIYVAYGDGTGHFRSNPAALSPLDDQAGLLSFRSTNVAVRWIGDLNQDGIFDIITSEAIIIRGSNGVPTWIQGTQCTNSDPKSCHVQVADFNGDGALDVLTGYGGILGFFAGSGREGRFNHTPFSVSGTVVQMVPGDFDGSGLPDVALVHVDPEGVSRLSMMFGNAFAPPSAPSTIAQFSQILGIYPGDLGVSGDWTTDLFVAVAPNEASDSANAPQSIQVGLFFGSTDRRPQSPFAFTDTTHVASADISEMAIAVGQFDSRTPNQDIAVLGATLDNQSKPTDPSVWFVPAQGEAELSNSSATSCGPLGPGFSTIIGIDLDQGTVQETEELVLLGVRPTLKDPGVLQIARAQTEPDGAQTWSLGQERELGFAPCIQQIFSEAFTEYEDPVQKQTALTIQEYCALGLPSLNHLFPSRGKLSSDENADLALLAVFPDADQSVDRHLVILPNLGDGTLGEPIILSNPAISFSDQGSAVQPGPGDDAEASLPLQFTLIQADADPEMEVVALFIPREGALTKGPELTASTAPKRLLLADLDLSTKQYRPIRWLDVPDALGLLAADVNGDGLHDLVVSGANSIDTYLGVAK